MKKLLSLLLALVMIFSLCACTDSGSSGKDSDDDEEEQEETKYPIVCEFKMDDMEYTLEIQKKAARVTSLQNTMTAEDLEWMDIYVDDVTVEYYFHMTGRYKLSKGVYILTLDTLLGSMTISGDDAEEAKEELIRYFQEEDEDASEKYEKMVNGSEEDITEEMDYPGGIVLVELDDGALKSMITYMDDDDSNYVEYTFHSNGQVKTETHYENHEVYVKYTYDKKGNQTDEWYPESDATGRPNETVTPMPPETYPTAPETYPTEPETEYWDYSYYADGSLQSETYYSYGIPSTQWTYYPDGSLESYRYWYTNGELCYVEYFDESGYLAEQSSYYENGNPQLFDRFYNNQLISREEFTEEGNILYFASFYYNGNMEREAYYYYNGCCESAYYYEENGDLDEYYRYYENEALHIYEDYVDGALLEGFVYDEYGNITESYGDGYNGTDNLLHNEEYTIIWSLSDMIEYGDNYFTANGAPVYICWDAPLNNWLDGYSLKAYVDAYGDEYLDTTYADLLTARMDSNGYVPLDIESYNWLLTTISGNPVWEEDESYVYLYLAYPNH